MAARAPDAVNGDSDHGADQDDEIEQAHEKILVSAKSRTTHRTKQPITKM